MKRKRIGKRMGKRAYINSPELLHTVKSDNLFEKLSPILAL